MSHIYKNQEDLLFIEEIYQDVQKYGYNDNLIEEILRWFIPQDNNQALIKYKISNIRMYPACFQANFNIIDVNTDKLLNWLDVSSKYLEEFLNIKNMELFRFYLFISTFAHEVEHGYQYLMGKEIIDSPCDYVRDGYKYLMDLLIKKDYILPRPITLTKRLVSRILYNMNQNKLVLERNAQVEAFDLLKLFAQHTSNEEMYECFNKLNKIYLRAGYLGDNNGSFEETYKTIHMMNKYKKLDTNYDLDEDTKLRYGLPVSEDTKKVILKKI
mgnify:CR=1 FL=1